MKRIIALLLALTMLLSLVSCGKKTPVADIVEDEVVQKVEETIVDKTEDGVVEMAPIAAETDRETLEQIADMVGVEKEDVSSMDDDTLKDFIYSEIDKEVADLYPSQNDTTADNPAVDATGKEEYYEEDGSMNQPFDVIYPELVENGDVEYATDALLLKISNSQGAFVTSGMKSAGVAKLEPVVPMSEYTWYKASLVKGTDISAAVTELRSLSEIEMVDYDYVVETTAMDDYQELPENLNGNQHKRWDLHYCGVPNGYGVMKNPGGSSSVIVAVIDTGVDYTHEDLKQNTWVNAAETPDNGIDDDRNGYVDDYYGVNIVAGKGNGNDDHGHGTHVAGIIAAQNNNLGIVGLAYNCKVMPIKAGNHSGYFLQSDIAKAVLYAYDHGAEVINMSFGGTACSQAVQDALATAYARCVLVAAAGNDGAPNEETLNGIPGSPSYPAALSYVVGVMAVDYRGYEASFSNWDVEAFNHVEYEVYAPGVDIISAIPGNGYASWSGTSMAAPYVSAIAAILRSEYTDRDKYPTKFIYGQICSTSEDAAACLDPEAHDKHNLPMIVNLHDALTKLPTPKLGVTDYLYFDTTDMTQDTEGNNNGDGAVDAGETIALGLTLRNQWGASKNTTVKIDTLQNGNLDPCISILDGYDTVNYGSVGTYATQDCGKIYTDEIITGWENPFYIKIADNCPNDYIVTLNVTITAENGMDEKDGATYTFEDTVSFVVRNGVVLPGVISEDMTLTADNLYIIRSDTRINEGATVTAMPGTRIQFWTADANDPYADGYIAKLTVAGAFITQGTDENPVYIYPSDLFMDYIVHITTTGKGYVAFDYTDITNFGTIYVSTIDTGFENNISATNSIFRANLGADGTYIYKYRNLENGQVITSSLPSEYSMINLAKAEACVFYKIRNLSLNTHLTDCAFVDSGISFTPKISMNDVDRCYTTIKDCLFLGNYKEFTKWGGVATSTSTFSVKSVPATISPIVVLHSDVDMSSTYVALKLNILYEPIVDKYMSSMGISKAKFETEEEWDWVRSQAGAAGVSSSYGVYFGATFDLSTQGYVWEDGTAVEDWVFDSSSWQYGSYTYTPVMSPNYAIVLSPNPVHFATNGMYYSRGDYVYFYEIPADSDVEIESEEALIAALTEELKTINPRFYGNTILNRVSTVVDTEKWLRPVAPTTAGATIPLCDNYWGTVNETAIELQMVDAMDYGTYSLLNYKPYLTEAPELVFPYVTDVTILDKNGEEVSRVGGEEIKVRVTFSRNMNTNQPVEVAFGSSEPYRDYIIEGAFVDERTWEGTYTVSTVIGNGYQYFSIGGGEADNGKDLYTDWYRFAFEIDTTAAQAMIMQGNATAEGITLTWMQDDFDTLMGYNVYRSTALDGQYQRLNSSVIPAETKTFFDDTVEPGKQYFYNFTVVKTDLTESDPSGKITIWSLDTMAPNVYHSAVGSATKGSNLMITATVTDNLRLETVKLMYRTTGAEEYKTATMTNNNDKYSAIIPAEDLSTDGLEYYIDAFDGISHTYWRSAETPWAITVLEPTTTSDLGDVDGNGVINLLDALMVLKAKNHKLNLDAAQFARADLDGNDTLETWEALRILQYASGTVGSVLPG